MKRGDRIKDYIASQPWLILRPALEAILDIASRDPIDIEALEARLGKPLDNAHAVSVHNGIAVIPVVGPIFRRANLFTDISGAVALETLATDFTTALDNEAIKGIIFAMDTPGGEVAGIGEFAALVYASRGRKPIKAHAELAASAGYWIAAATGEIVTTPAAVGLGSIGCAAYVVKHVATDGQEEYEFVSSVSPNKHPDVATKEGHDQIQKWVNDLGNEFVSAVAAYRGVSIKTVLARYGKGDVYVGRRAVAAGMADRHLSLEGLIAEMASGGKRATEPKTLQTRKGEVMSRKATAKQTIGKPLAGPGGCQWDECGSFEGEDVALPCERENCGHLYDEHADAVEESEPASPAPEPVPEASEALAEQVRKLTARLAESDARADAEAQKRVAAEANAKVDGWEREGRMSGNRTKAFRSLYVTASTGGAVTVAQVEAAVATLPTLAAGAGERVSAGAVVPDHVPVTLADLRRAAFDPAASKRVAQAVAARKTADPKFTARDLEFELTS